jgi:transcriptional regulator with GAF, ATPase, and Fis domain
MRCATCHEEVAIVSNFCPFCGSPLAAVNHAHLEGIRLFCEGAYEAASAKLQFARAIDPADPAVAKDLAHALLHAGHTGKASKIYAEILRSHLHYADASFNYALLMMNSRDMTTARSLLRSVTENSRIDFYPGRFYLGLLYPTLNSFLSDVFLYLGQIEMELLRSDEATGLLHLAVEKNAQQVSAYIALGDLGMQQRNYAEAIERYSTAMTLQPLGDEIAELHLKLGMAYQQTDDIAEAIKEFRWVLQRDPHSIAALENLNRIYEQQGGQREEAGQVLSGAAIEGASPIFGLSVSGRSADDSILTIGNTPEMRRVMRHARIAAASDSTVLVIGENGTGKELIARTIVQNSPRRDRPFVTINCAAIPEALLESDLFGHERGAFTDAKSQKKGRFETAHMGTIFLDEIGELSPALQVKLLRVLQEREFNRVGGNEVVKVDVRVIAATNRILEQLISRGLFREDLFYRLNVVPIHIPPLRERRDDIPLLVDYFLQKLRKLDPKHVVRFSPEEMELFMEHNWPGNVRELENMVERAVVMGTQSGLFLQELTKLRRTHSPRHTPAPGDDVPEITLDALEHEHIQRVMRKVGGNQKRAADILGINQSTLWRKLRRMSAEKPPAES